MTGPAEEVGRFLRRCGVGEDVLERWEAMERLREALTAANRAVNLTRITSREDFWRFHVADSLSLGLLRPGLLGGAATVADVGCGAGFPMLPLAWANGRLTVVGMESRRKKAAFAADQARALGLANASVAVGRAGELARTDDHAGRYDAVLLRAVGPADRLVRECRRLLRPGGGAEMIFYKTPRTVAAERGLFEREACKFGLLVEVSEVLSLPGGARRQFVVLSTGRPGERVSAGAEDG